LAAADSTVAAVSSPAAALRQWRSEEALSNPCITPHRPRPPPPVAERQRSLPHGDRTLAPARLGVAGGKGGRAVPGEPYRRHIENRIRPRYTALSSLER